MRAIKKLDNYRLYKIDNHYELWHGKYNTETDVMKRVGLGVRVGYVSDPRNFETCVHEAEENFKWEMKAEGLL